jgi:tetratricopeptide (TPR) repeat protein
MTMISLRLFICIFCVFLFSCAGGDLKQDEDSGVVNNKSTHVDVDTDVELDFKSALALMQQEKYRQAIDVLKTVIGREQRLPAPYINIAIAYNKLGETKDAELNLINALKLDISHPVANNELGLLYRKAGKFNAARTAYENAINEHPDYLPARRNLGILCDLYMHDFECALEQFENYAELKPDDKDAAIWVADVKRRLGQ